MEELKPRSRDRAEGWWFAGKDRRREGLAVRVESSVAINPRVYLTCRKQSSEAVICSCCSIAVAAKALRRPPRLVAEAQININAPRQVLENLFALLTICRKSDILLDGALGES